MNEKEFCYWLQGFFELTDTEELSKEQVAMIKSHLSLVFTKVTPPLKMTDTLNPPEWWLEDNLPSTQVFC